MPRLYMGKQYKVPQKQTKYCSVFQCRPCFYFCSIPQKAEYPENPPPPPSSHEHPLGHLPYFLLFDASQFGGTQIASGWLDRVLRTESDTKMLFWVRMCIKKQVSHGFPFSVMRGPQTVDSGLDIFPERLNTPPAAPA